MALNAQAEIFTTFKATMTVEQELRDAIREQVRDLENTAREFSSILENIQLEGGIEKIPELCIKARELLPKAREQFTTLSLKVPIDQYYRYNDHWRFTMQRFNFSMALLVYLETQELTSIEEVAGFLGLKVKQTEGFHIDLEDHLCGLLSLSSELSRFAVNSVTAGDFQRPRHILKFITELNAGFQLLSFKNDALRRKYDGLKYDLKKIEQIVYDLSIRGLKPAPSESSNKVEQPLCEMAETETMVQN